MFRSIGSKSMVQNPNIAKKILQLSNQKFINTLYRKKLKRASLRFFTLYYHTLPPNSSSTLEEYHLPEQIL